MKSSGTHLILTTSSYLRSSNRHGYLPSARSVSSSRNESQMSIFNRVLTCWIDAVMPASCDLLPSRRYLNWTLPASPFLQQSKAPLTVEVKVSQCCNWHFNFCYYCRPLSDSKKILFDIDLFDASMPLRCSPVCKCVVLQLRRMPFSFCFISYLSFR